MEVCWLFRLDRLSITNPFSRFPVLQFSLALFGLAFSAPRSVDYTQFISFSAILLSLSLIGILCCTSACETVLFENKKLIRRWNSERELSSRRHRARTTKYNRLAHKFCHRSTRLCVGTHVFTKFSEITQYNGHYIVQGHSCPRFWYQSKAHIRLAISD